MDSYWDRWDIVDGILCLLFRLACWPGFARIRQALPNPPVF